MNFSSMAIEMRGSVKFLTALLAFEDRDLMEKRMAIQMISTVEPLSTNLAEKYFIFRIGMCKNVLLEQMLLYIYIYTYVRAYARACTRARA